MSQALYRKYRPRLLAEVIGQEHITETLGRAIQAGTISHAYLFTGPRGVGKTSVARILAHEINRLAYTESPQLDIIEIDAASNRRIDDIRDLREKVHITPVHAPYKVYIIDEVHMLTGESFNALLKTLEEPPSHVIFILATTESHKIPATIISRTQRFTFRPVDTRKVVKHLRAIADKENIAISDEALHVVAEHGEGSFRDSIGLLDQMAHVTNGTIEADDARQALGMPSQAAIHSLADALTAADRPAITASLQQLEQQGAAIGTIVTQLCRALLPKATEHPVLYRIMDELLEVPRAYNPQLKLLTTLMAHTLTHHVPQTQPPTQSLKTPPAHTKKPVIKKTEDNKKSTINASVVKDTAESPIHTEALKSMSPHDWAKVLEAVKKASQPLYTVIKQAQPILDDGGQLVLKFKFGLHSKKIDDAKNKMQLAGIIKATLGTAPAILTQVDKMATPLTAAADPEIADIAAIMGGGEILSDAETA